MSASGYKATRWGDPSHVRLRLRKRTSEPITAAHKDLFVSNVCFAIRKRTFAATNLNDRFGSIPALEWTKFRRRRMSPSGYKRTF
jgi:hypothetical protein